MSFEPKLRRLAKTLPECEVPSELHGHILAQLPSLYSRKKGHVTMKTVLIPALALAFGGGGGLLVVQSIQTARVAQRTPVQTGPITLHFVDDAGKPVSGVSVSLSRYEKSNPRTGAAPAQRVSDMPVGTSNQSGDLLLPPQGITNFYASFEQEPIFGTLGPVAGSGSLGPTKRLFAAGQITVSEGQQVVALSEHPVHSVTGQLVDEQGTPLTDAQPELYVGSQLFSKLHTYPDGRFIAWVVPKTDYTLLYHHTGPGNPIHIKNLRVDEGKFLDLGTITVRSGTW
ncbi:hypothetical protein [Armatimonas rosea]|uniref:Uncharacterized protein n=1 Tax=Armatimonas rosea TaxID=685828 RepID=A0A7W9W4Y5_ARMRO|nr:hypothetical protein [Armatimonas rosea]MBB6049894.1 hypothetical protein [Armatimonas rosea]